MKKKNSCEGAHHQNKFSAKYDVEVHTMFRTNLSEDYKVMWSKPRTTCTDSLDLINAFGIGTNWTVAC